MQTYRPYKSYSYRQVQRVPPQARRRSRRRPAVLLALAALALAVGINILMARGYNKPPAAPAVLAESSNPAATEEKQIETIDTSVLQASLDQITAKYNFDTSIAVIDLNSGEVVQSGDNAAFIAASTTKLLTAVYYMHEVEAGRASLDQQIQGKSAREHMRLMINRSDNPSWDTVNKYLNYSRMEAFAKSNGLSSFRVKDNTIASDDMARLLSKIYKKELINEQHTALLLSWMQNTSEERFIPPGVPTNIKFYHKAGYLPDRAHDAAIIDNGKAPFALVVFSKAPGPTYNYATGQKLFKEVTTEVLNVFSR